jgi:allantoinase
MTARPSFDLIVKNVRVVRPNQVGTPTMDVGVRDGRFTMVADELDAGNARAVYDGKGRLAFPGVTDGHMHVGIYSPLPEDAVTESKAAAAGGVTSTLTYFRTGDYYLNKAGRYAEFYPEVLALSEGRYWVDYGYHLAPINRVHIAEMSALALEHGVPSFKIFMFYGGHGLHGRSDMQRNFLRLEEGESYDFAHFEFIMRELHRLYEVHPERRDHFSLSLHCEVADILNAYTAIVEREGKLKGLPAYHAARPPHAEGLAVFIASYLAYETQCANINLLHLSSRKALEAALMMRDLFPHIDFRREVTIGHLLLDVDSPAGPQAKVNPPIRPRADVEYLWEKLLAGEVDWVVSDHACCKAEFKVDAKSPGDIWLAKSGFGGTEYLLSGLYSEGRKRGLTPNRIAELLCWNPTRRFGLLAKGDIAPGYDADLVLLDPDESFVVRAAESESGQGYTPFEGQELTGKVKATFLRGELIYENGQIKGPPRGRYLHRPTPGPRPTQR